MKLYSTILSTLSEFDREFVVFHFVLTENTKTEYDKSKEKELLQEMLEVVEKREQLISDVEDTKKRLKILVDSLCKTMIKVLKTIFFRNVVCTFRWCSLCYSLREQMFLSEAQQTNY